MTAIDISVVIPTRGRTEALGLCLQSLLDTANNPGNFEILLAFDDDDVSSQEYFASHIVPVLDKTETVYTALSFPRMGYLQLNRYVNALVEHSRGKWVFMFNDDARMITPGWDSVIIEQGDVFSLLRAETNHEHPYAIFPILPREWFEFFGYWSPHQLNDAWVSQVAFMLDIVTTVPIYVEHDRFDLTGKNQDETYANRPQLEGNPNNPADFNHATWRNHRLRDCAKLADYLHKTRNYNMDHWREVLQGKRDPWKKMMSLDTKGRLAIYPPGRS